MSIVTVTGAVDAQELGVTLAHEHVLINLYKVYQPHRDMFLYDEQLASAELRRFADIGGGAVLDLTTPDIGRDPQALKRISIETGVKIVMGAGMYRAPFYVPDVDTTSTRSLTERFVRDIVDGESGIMPGVVGEIGTDGPYVSAVEERVHRAAARAAAETGLSLVTHSLGSAVGSAQAQLLIEEGLPSNRIAIGHADTWPDAAYHQSLLDLGCYLIFDTLRGLVPYETQRTIGLIKSAIDHGFGSRILLSHDVCGTSHYSAYGGNGYAFVPGDDFRAKLESAGIDGGFLNRALTSNVYAFLEGTA